MRIPDIESIPFHAIATALSATPHSRRMAGVLLATKMTSRYRVSHECMSPEFAEVVVDFKDEDTDFRLLAAGLLPRTRIVEYAEKAMAFDGTTVGTGDLFKNVLFSLGSPLIGGMAKDLYVAFSAPKGRDVSKPVRVC